MKTLIVLVLLVLFATRASAQFTAYAYDPEKDFKLMWWSDTNAAKMYITYLDSSIIRRKTHLDDGSYVDSATMATYFPSEEPIAEHRRRRVNVTDRFEFLRKCSRLQQIIADAKNRIDTLVLSTSTSIVIDQAAQASDPEKGFSLWRSDTIAAKAYVAYLDSSIAAQKTHVDTLPEATLTENGEIKRVHVVYGLPDRWASISALWGHRFEAASRLEFLRKYLRLRQAIVDAKDHIDRYIHL